MELTEEEAEYVKSLELLSYKPAIYAANVSEEMRQLRITNIM